MIENDNFNDLYKDLIKYVMHNGEKVAPRGNATIEVFPMVFRLHDITKSLLTIKDRKLAYPFNAAEKLCFITGESGEIFLPKYAPNISQFINSSNGRYDGAYGPRIFPQLKRIINLLKKDPDSRRAIISIHNYHNDIVDSDSLDIPCTMFMHFMIREDKLNMSVHMRGNDLFWGTPYNVSQFTFIQEVMAKILGLEYGHYTHMVDSFHIYERDLNKFKKILSCNEVSDQQQMPLDISDYGKIIREATFALYGWDTAEDLQSKYFQQQFNLLNKKHELY